MLTKLVKVGIIANRHKAGAKAALLELCQALEEQQIEVSLETQTALIINDPDGVEASTFASSCDLVAVLGGDGTMINATNQIGASTLPVAGINIGTLGFLTTCTDKEIGLFAQSIAQKNYTLIERALVRASITKSNGDWKTFRALNEITLTRSDTGRLISLDAWVDGELLNRYRADGLIVATATGSTAYSLSAGGPLIDPKAKAFVITPICPHSLSNRSVIVSDQSTIELAPTDDDQCPMLFTIDGREMVEICAGDKISVELAQNTLPLLQLDNRNFYSTLRQKLGWR